MSRPPLLARALLRAVASRRDRDFVEGDLLEEYRTFQLPAHGPAAARRWFVRQVLRSSGPLLALRLRRGEFLRELALAQFLVLGVMLGLHGIWKGVLAQVPLRADGIAAGSEAASIVGIALAAAAATWAYTRVTEANREACPLVLTAALIVAAFALEPLLGVELFVSFPVVLAGLTSGALAGASLARSGGSGATIRRCP